MSGIALLLLAASSVGAGLNVTATPPALNSGADTTGGFTSAATTAIPSGGSGSYTYAWAISEVPSEGSLSITSPTVASTTVSITTSGTNMLVEGAIECTVTDTVSLETATVTVSIRHRAGLDAPI